MRFVIDTNVLISGTLNLGGPPGRLLVAAADARVELVAPTSVREEFRDTLRTKLRWGPEDAEEALEALPVEWVEGSGYEPLLDELRGTVKDPDDVPLVAVAKLLGVRVVSGDKAFHPMRRPVVKTLKPKEAMDLVDPSQERPGAV